MDTIMEERAQPIVSCEVAWLRERDPQLLPLTCPGKQQTWSWAPKTRRTILASHRLQHLDVWPYTSPGQHARADHHGSVSSELVQVEGEYEVRGR